MLARTLMVFILIALPALSWLHSQDADKPQVPYPISKETTYFTGPLLADGAIDYFAALNEKMLRGMTKENNAAVLLLQALGPRIRDDFAYLPNAYLQMLGMSELPKEGDYLLDGYGYLKKFKVDLRDAAYAAELSPWTRDKYPEVTRWLDYNAKPLSLITQASHLPFCQFPRTPIKDRIHWKKDSETWSDSALNGIALFQCTRALLVRAMLNIGERTYQAAWNDLLTIMRLSRLQAQGARSMDLSFGLRLDGEAYETTLVLLETGVLDTKLLSKIKHDLEALPSFPQLVEKVELGDRVHALYGFIQDHQQKITKLDKDQLQETLRTTDWKSWLTSINAYHNRLVEILREPDRAKRLSTLKAYDLETQEERDYQNYNCLMYARGHPNGKYLAMQMSVGSFTLQYALYLDLEQKLQKQQNLSVAISLAQYRQARGAYPNSLNDLAPTYMPSVPNDVLSGKPLKYSKTEQGYLLYSVGLNGKDEAGLSRRDDPVGDDISIQIPRPKPMKKNE